MSGFDFNKIGDMAQGFLNSQGGNNNQRRNDNDDEGYGNGGNQGFGGNQGYGNNDNQGYGRDDNQGYGNNDDNRQQQHHSGGGGGGGFDFGSLAGLAQDFSSGNHDNSLFSQAASFVQNQGGRQDVDEQQLLQDNDEVHNQPGANSSGQIGNAAALSAIKSLLSGGGGQQQQQQQGGGFQQKLMSMAMSHAADLYDQKDAQGQAQGSKQDAVNSAAQMAMGLAMKNPSMLMGLIGGGNSGGLGALAGMLGK